ncbi:hypothetical protein Hanom_Chr04g00368211 [Helianthus anomalus]
MAMGICRQGSLSGGELGREIPSAVRGTVQLPLALSRESRKQPDIVGERKRYLCVMCNG